MDYSIEKEEILLELQKIEFIPLDAPEYEAGQHKKKELLDKLATL